MEESQRQGSQNNGKNSQDEKTKQKGQVREDLV